MARDSIAHRNVIKQFNSEFATAQTELADKSASFGRGKQQFDGLRQEHNSLVDWTSRFEDAAEAARVNHVHEMATCQSEALCLIAKAKANRSDSSQDRDQLETALQ